MDEVSIPARTLTIPDDPYVPPADQLSEIALRQGSSFSDRPGLFHARRGWLQVWGCADKMAT